MSAESANSTDVAIDDAPGLLAGPSIAADQAFSIQVFLDAAEEQRVAAIRDSAQNLLAQILGSDDHSVWNMREVVWPALCLDEFNGIALGNVSLRLIPLSRIGQMEGKSGSLVLIGYFSSPALGDLHSHPLVIKTRDVSKPEPEKLDEEFKNAKIIKPFAYDKKDSFSIPIFLDRALHGYKVLWSICSLPAPLWDGPTAGREAVKQYTVDDLRAPLREDNHEKAKKTISDVFDLLRPCHTRFNRRQIDVRVAGEEYSWYLRSYGTGEAGTPVWGPEWQNVWGKPAQRYLGGVESGGVNPLWVLDRLRALQYPMAIGAVHGDLHPGNIVYASDDRPVLIDFGWAQGSSHIAKDFVLMECNLRFLTLRAQLKDEELENFVSWVGWGEPIPDSVGEYLTVRAEMIANLRGKAEAVLTADSDRTHQYLIPLFFVAFGLLRFAPQLGNQRAAIRLVESLAGHLSVALNL